MACSGQSKPGKVTACIRRQSVLSALMNDVTDKD